MGSSATYACHACGDSAHVVGGESQCAIMIAQTFACADCRKLFDLHAEVP